MAYFTICFPFLLDDFISRTGIWNEYTQDWVRGTGVGYFLAILFGATYFESTKSLPALYLFLFHALHTGNMLYMMHGLRISGKNITPKIWVGLHIAYLVLYLLAALFPQEQEKKPEDQKQEKKE